MKNFLNRPRSSWSNALVNGTKNTSILKNSKHVEEARHVIFDYLNRLDRDLYNMKSDTYFVDLNIIEKRNARNHPCSHEHDAVGE